MTRAQEIRERADALMAEGKPRPEAFAQVAEEFSVKLNSVRGAYYAVARETAGATRSRRRETTPEDALADARATLERAIESIDREVQAAKVRADEAKAEYESQKASAAERKAAISERLEALK
jgi:chromosome segregation ATPase